MTSFFVLGTHPTLSIAEIAAVLGPGLDFSRSSSEVLILDGVSESAEILQERLAGVIKIGTVTEKISKWNLNEVADQIADGLSSCEKKENPSQSKLSFGISVYDLENPTLAKQLARERLKLGLEIKKRLRKEGRPVRFVEARERALSSVVVWTNHLLETGGEVVLIAAKNGLYLGRTQAVQDFQAWSQRDYGRPARDAKSGMLPPKLAHLMVNLSGLQKKGTLLDPFCGSGTVLMEAALLGIHNLLGSDTSEKAIADTRTNMDWLTKPFPSIRPSIQLFTSQAEDLPRRLRKPVDAIVTEPYLGPSLTGHESEIKIRNVIRELTSLYTTSFRSLSGILRPGGRLVLASPAFQRQNGHDPLCVPVDWARLGFCPIRLLPSSIPPTLSPLSFSGGLFYARPDQHIGREILIFSKKKKGV
ncbi:MAG TPA: DNA methyltransferase [Patescibacteria group bacterium]|nr:DNA methyltransferase [Patescibacteria group bacterium]